MEVDYNNHAIQDTLVMPRDSRDIMTSLVILTWTNHSLDEKVSAFLCKMMYLARCGRLDLLDSANTLALLRNQSGKFINSLGNEQLLREGKRRQYKKFDAREINGFDGSPSGPSQSDIGI